MLQLSFDGILRRKEIAESALKYGSGVESIYYQLNSEKGIKIIRCPFHSNDRGRTFKTEEDLRRSDVWSRVQAQYDTMQYFSSINRGPKVFEMLSVFDEGHESFYPAIIMEHIEFTPIEYFPAHKEGKRLCRAYEKFCRKLGEMIGNTDAHTGNVVFDERDSRFKIIDFGALDPLLAHEHGRARMKELYLERKRIHAEMKEERKNEARIHRPVFIDFEVRIDGPMVNVIGHQHVGRKVRHIITPDSQPLAMAGMDRVKELKRRHNEFIKKFIPKQDDYHSRKFKNAA